MESLWQIAARHGLFSRFSGRAESWLPRGERTSKHGGSNNHSKGASKKARKLAARSRRINRTRGA